MNDSITLHNLMQWPEERCREYLEKMRWPDGPRCPKCGTTEPYTLRRKTANKNNVRKLYKCRECKRQFTSTVGTIFEDSKIPLNKWFAAIYLMCSSKKGISAHQIHRTLGVTYKSAWFMCHRVREAMRDKNVTPLSGIIEADETYVGGKPRRHPARKIGTMRRAVADSKQKQIPVLGMLERGGRVRAIPIKPLKKKDVESALKFHLDLPRSRLITDEHPYYHGISRYLPHDKVLHKQAYLMGEDVHTQGIEGFWSLLKRGLIGTFHHCKGQYLECYVDEFSFRFNERKISDAERFASLMGQTQGRLTWFCQTPQPENPHA